MICSCGNTRHTHPVPALGHDWVLQGRDIVCSRCGAVQIRSLQSEGNELDEAFENDLILRSDEIDETASQSDEIEVLNEDYILESDDDDQELRSGGQIIESETSISYAYIYAGGKLLQEKVTTGQTTETHNFFYDNSGTPYAILVDSTVYYYITNLQGDVIGIIDENGHIIAEYEYDPYGKITSLKAFDTLGSPISVSGSIAEKNPLRYRGYYYDSEMGLYYLQSRYYDPNICRFINADDVSNVGANGDVISLNLFVYCGNNPISRKDSNGNAWVLTTMLIGGIVGSIVNATISAFTQYAFNGSVDLRKVKTAALVGFVGGAVFASPLGIQGQRIAGGIIGGVSYLMGQIAIGEPINGVALGVSVVAGVFCGQLGGPGANEGCLLSDAINGSFTHNISTLTTCSINNYVLNATHNAGFLYSMCSYIGNAVDAVCDFFINLFS